MKYHKEQNLNDWVGMFSSVYGLTTNQTKSRYEIFTHLTEVTLAFGKMFFKRRDLNQSKKFLPKIFAWSLALIEKVKGEKSNLEEIILTKFPKVCPYCTKAPCDCIPKKKSRIDEKALRDLYFQNSEAQKRTLNDFQLMFKSIYGATWKIDDFKNGSEEYFNQVSILYLNMTEELSELSEALRFYQLYPTHFDNEMADFLAWWFAIISCFNKAYNYPFEKILAEDIVWEKYPGICSTCLLNICDCRPGPVRELLSKPSMKEMVFVDGLTQAYNKLKFDQDVQDIKSGSVNMPTPIACIRIDLDDFKKINNDFSHEVGDNALKYLVSSIRQKIRSRDRLYRLGGDEFGILCPDLSNLEAEGMLTRVSNHMKLNPFGAISNKSQKEEKITITLSVGIAECSELNNISNDFNHSDELAIKSKQSGKDQITTGNLKSN